MEKIIFVLSLFFLTVVEGYAQTQVDHQAVSKTTNTRDSLLKAMNRIKTKEYYELSSMKKGKPCRILVLGNSLARHGIAENIGWTAHDGGMAATKEDSDYVHLLFKKMETLYPDRKIYLRVASIVKFEREFPSFDFQSLTGFIQYKPDILIFQLGENSSLNEANTSLFREKYVEMINCFKKERNPLVICTTPFFPDLKKNEVIGQVVLLTNSYLVDLSHLPLLDNQNYAKDEINYAGDKSKWKVAGIGIHPGDYGMRNIAQQIFIVINAAIRKTEVNR